MCTSLNKASLFGDRVGMGFISFSASCACSDSFCFHVDVDMEASFQVQKLSTQEQRHEQGEEDNSRLAILACGLEERTDDEGSGGKGTCTVCLCVSTCSRAGTGSKLQTEMPGEWKNAHDT